MNSKVCFKLSILALIIFLFAGCNNQDNMNNPKAADRTLKDTTATIKNFSFDTSRSVTKISPNLYKQLADTLNIKILQGIYKPGDSSILHAHPDFALYVLEGSMVELTTEDGKKQNIEFKKDMAVVLPAATHSAKNVGKSTLKLIVVEVNRPRD